MQGGGKGPKEDYLSIRVPLSTAPIWSDRMERQAFVF